MSHPIFHRVTGLLTAAALLTAGIPAGMTVSAADSSAGINTDTLDQAVERTASDDLLTLAYLSLMTSSYLSVGTPDTFLSVRSRVVLDADASGSIDMKDAYLLLCWDSYRRLNGTYQPEAQAYFARYSAETTTAEAATTVPITTTVQTQTETTLSATLTASSEAASSDTTAATESTAVSGTDVGDPTVAAASETTTAVTSSTDASAVSTVTTTTTAATTTTTVTTTAAVTAAKTVYNGIDVSKYQGNVDWSKVKKSGKDFAIIRAGYGKYASQEDPYFDQNMKNAKAAGVACGAYWFSYAETVADAKQEAEVFASVISGYQFEYPLVFDIEAPVHTKMTKEQVSAIITAFCDTMESKGYYVSLYSYASFLNSYVYDSVLEKYDIWVAHFGVSTPSYSKTAYGMWQYSSTGSVSGITGDVDLDYSYRNYSSIMTRAHLNGY